MGKLGYLPNLQKLSMQCHPTSCESGKEKVFLLRILKCQYLLVAQLFGLGHFGSKQQKTLES